ncbi:hypothetical protein GCM10010472_01430 [Pseudonocardia halophobica]|uniref:ATP/GTP-binding protein n=1 Tax=Pseudonocardia halophobica TaxID=29401 RepID=A0A9W6NVD3_9PSEU|nr:hypothetical protein GCM10017577_16230 [Pseudonocardia halophobica]
MLTRRVATVATALLVAPYLGHATASAAPGGCRVLSAMGLCLVEAADPGRPGGPSAHQPVEEPAQDRPAAPRRPSIAPSREIAERIPEMLRQNLLGIAPPEEVSVAGAPAAVAQAAAPVDPAVPTRIAINRLELQKPTIRLSGQDEAYVGVPVWLWIDQAEGAAEAATASAAVGDANVVATARLSGVEWSMGPDGAEVFCTGPGTPWTGQPGPSPDCGYTYEERSLPARTAGAGRWTIVATAVWQVGWEGFSGGQPVVGGQELRLDTELEVPVDEVQVLVTGGGR